ncbi:hypothetical protein GH714_019282 [Hevea brasiliensis]|uniref:BI1-like protein n=1 Tax=Hevea brasiliensis TaxID=3981 RepID=A0A6A6MFP5_HEVBR|nr:hypothetical protein GH714_019282 [Hevea brasiliensis]
MYGFSSLSTKDLGKEVDLEAGNGETLYPGLSLGENQLRWGLIRKVYGILAVQLMLTTIVSAFTVLYTPVNALLGDSPGLLLLLCIVPFILLWPLHVFHQKHPVNLILLGLFTVSLSLLVGVSCANTDGKIVLEALILTSVVMFFPLGSTSTAIYGGISALVFSGYIIYDTDNLIKRFSYDEYILASAALYLDILNLFLSILRVLSQRSN